MPSAIVETPTKGSVINAPVGADPRTAASVSTPFQAVGNRLKYLENRDDELAPLIEGGTLEPAAPVTIDEALTVEGQLTVNALVNADALRGRRRLRVAKPTGSASYAAADGIDLVYVDRTALGAGTTTITIDDTGYGDGDMIQVVARNASGGKNVSIAVPGLGTIAAGDTNQRYYTFVRLGAGDWNILISNLD